MLILHENLLNSNDAKLKNYVVQYKKIYKNVIWKAKQMYLEGVIENSTNKIKASWDVIKSETSQQISVASSVSLNVNNYQYDNPNEVAELFNNYFEAFGGSTSSNQSTGSAIKILEKFRPRTPECCLLSSVTRQEIIKVAQSLKPKTSTDLWYVSSRLLKSSTPALADYLCALFNSCIGEGTFPDKLKLAKIIPMFKKGCRENIDNYRPISILPSFSKILEKIILNRLTKFFDTHDIINSKQFGFRAGLSTVNATSKLLHKLLNGLDDSKTVIGLFCDLSKAFDCVNHNILLNKLEHYGIRDKGLNLIQSYLKNRYQTTEVKGTRSQPILVTKGVPQGSILGPFLFLVYINDLPGCVSSENDDITLFADDTSLIFCDKNKESLINRVRYTIDQLLIWFNANELRLNITKSKIIPFCLRPTNSDYLNKLYDNFEIDITQDIIFLGLRIDSKLLWNTHIDQLASKLCSSIYSIKKIRSLCGFAAARSVYFAYFNSLMTYGLLFWGNAANSKRIFLLQKRALRSMYQVSPRTSCREYFNKARIMTMHSAFIYQCLMYARQHLKETATRADIHSHQTRGSSLLCIPRTRLAKVQKSYLYLSIKFYNLLPTTFKQLEDVKLKKNIKEILIGHPFYDLTEFECYDFSNILPI